MKKIFGIFILISLFCNRGISQTNDPIVNQLLNINVSEYTGKPLDSIISILPQGYTTMKVMGIRGTARMVYVKYPNKVWIELHVRQFLFMNPDDPSRVWNLALMRKENLHSIGIHKGANCYTGCPTY